MPEHLHDRPCRDACGEQEGRASVPQVVKPQPVQPRLCAQNSHRRLTLRGSIGVPIEEARTSPVSCHASPSVSRSVFCRSRCSRTDWTASLCRTTVGTEVTVFGFTNCKAPPVRCNARFTCSCRDSFQCRPSTTRAARHGEGRYRVIVAGRVPSKPLTSDSQTSSHLPDIPSWSEQVHPMLSGSLELAKFAKGLPAVAVDGGPAGRRTRSATPIIDPAPAPKDSAPARTTGTTRVRRSSMGSWHSRRAGTTG
jgi:hypothetical protein